MQLIENTENLSLLCQRLSKENFVCVDLEFLRQHTYFAELCLIQIASPNEAAIIDPLAKDINLQAFFDLMQNPNIVKVFHSGRQDIEILYNLTSKIPTPIFDTQIAASVAGFGESISYENLVNHILNISIDKSSRLSDWSKRPLSENQLSYALSDVTHLVLIYQHLKSWLEEQNRIDWIKDDIANICNENLYKINVYDAWQKMRHRSHSPRFLTLLRELAAWRETRAINKNVPRHSFIKDELLLNICADCPQNKDDLTSVRGMRADMASGIIGDEIIDVIQKFKLLDKDDYVTPPKIKDFSGVDGPLFELLKLLLRIKAQEHKIVPHMLACDNDLKMFCQHRDNYLPNKHEWQNDIFWKDASKIKTGQIAISYDQKTNSIKFISISK